MALTIQPMPLQCTAAIYSAMGGLDKRRFSRFKALLKLGDEAIELADRHSLEEGLLRHILPLHDAEQVEVIRHVIAMNLTVKQVKDLCSSGSVEPNDSENETAIPRHTIQLAKLMKSVKSSSSDALAKYLIDQERDVALAKARLQSLRTLLDKTEELLG